MNGLPKLNLRKLLALCAALLAGPLLAADEGVSEPKTSMPAAICLMQNNGHVQLDKTGCSIYINGFLDGAELTDSVIIDKVRDRSDFFQRAYATRIGSYKEPLPATYFADFCISKEIPRQQVVSEVLRELEQHSGAQLDQRSAIYFAIKKLYPCATKK